jgi:hypothetical protein
MEPIQINVAVNIGVTPELSEFLSMLLDRKQVTPCQAREPEEKKEVVVEAPAVINPEPAEPEQPVPLGEPTVKELTEVDVREAMDRCRKRIEGEDYKENTSSEGYKKWHRQLTSWFKNTSAALGAEKPSALPDHDSRAAFIEMCEQVTADGDKLTTNVPF